MKKGWNIARSSEDKFLVVSPDDTLSIGTYYPGSIGI